MVDVNGSYQYSSDLQPKSLGLVWRLAATRRLVWRLAATRRSVCIHRMNRVNSRNDFGHDDDSMVINILLLLLCIPAPYYN